MAGFAELSMEFKQRVSADGHPFTDMLYSWRDSEGVIRHALSRVWWVISDTPMDRSRELQGFIKRRTEFEKWTSSTC